MLNWSQKSAAVSNPARVCAIVGGFCLTMLFLFVPETFWDRTPRPKSRVTSKKASRRPSGFSLFKHKLDTQEPAPDRDVEKNPDSLDEDDQEKTLPTPLSSKTTSAHRSTQNLHVGFAPAVPDKKDCITQKTDCGEGLTSLFPATNPSPVNQNPEQMNSSGKL